MFLEKFPYRVKFYTKAKGFKGWWWGACGAVGIGTGAVLFSIPEGACACGAEGPMASIGPLALGAKGCVEGLCIASLRGPPIGGQDRDGASYRCSALYTLCLFEAFPSRGNEKIGGTGYCVTYDTER